jgi:hypothetical protein
MNYGNLAERRDISETKTGVYKEFEKRYGSLLLGNCHET